MTQQSDSFFSLGSTSTVVKDEVERRHCCLLSNKTEILAYVSLSWLLSSEPSILLYRKEHFCSDSVDLSSICKSIDRSNFPRGNPHFSDPNHYGWEKISRFRCYVHKIKLVVDKDKENKWMVKIPLYSMLDEGRQRLNVFFAFKDTANEHITHAKLSDEVQNTVDVIFWQVQARSTFSPCHTPNFVTARCQSNAIKSYHLIYVKLVEASSCMPGTESWTVFVPQRQCRNHHYMTVEFDSHS